MNGHLISYQPGRKTVDSTGTWYLDRETVANDEAYPKLGLPQ